MVENCTLITQDMLQIQGSADVSNGTLVVPRCSLISWRLLLSFLEDMRSCRRVYVCACACVRHGQPRGRNSCFSVDYHLKKSEGHFFFLKKQTGYFPLSVGSMNVFKGTRHFTGG